MNDPDVDAVLPFFVTETSAILATPGVGIYATAVHEPAVPRVRVTDAALSAPPTSNHFANNAAQGVVPNFAVTTDQPVGVGIVELTDDETKRKICSNATLGVYVGSVIATAVLVAEFPEFAVDEIGVAIRPPPLRQRASNRADRKAQGITR